MRGSRETVLDSWGNVHLREDRPNDLHWTGVRDKDSRLPSVHYSETDPSDRTVYGAKRAGLHYNYDDRLVQWDYEKWNEGYTRAIETDGVTPGSVRAYELALNHFHDTDDVEIAHVVAGCNLSNGFPYYVFGYTYTEKV